MNEHFRACLTWRDILSGDDQRLDEEQRRLNPPLESVHASQRKLSNTPTDPAWFGDPDSAPF